MRTKWTAGGRKEALAHLKRHYSKPGHPVAYASRRRINQFYSGALSNDDIDGVLSHFDAHTLHKTTKRPRYNKHINLMPRDQVQADLMDVQHLSHFVGNKGTRYILVVKDPFTRFAWCVAIPDKKSNTVRDAFKLLLKSDMPAGLNNEMHGRKVDRLLVDLGLEFRGNPFRNFLKKESIRLTHPRSSGHCPHVEVFQRTLQSLMYKHMEHNETNAFVDVLPELLRTYNERPHTSLDGLSPLEAEQPVHFAKVRLADSKRLAKVKAAKPGRSGAGSASGSDTAHWLREGQPVRITKEKTAFWRGYKRQNRREIFFVRDKVDHYRRPMFRIEDAAGEPLLGKKKNVAKLRQKNTFTFAVFSSRFLLSV